MENKQTVNYDAVALERARIEMLTEAYKQFPNLRVGMTVYNDSSVGMQDYNQYLTIINQFPVATTSNHVS